jgi:uncharacterized membrane protein YidH (DUF202 family)
VTPTDTRGKPPPARNKSGWTAAKTAEEADPGLARERTDLAWTRTAISFAALGGAILKATPVAGVLVLAMAALIWGLGRLSRRYERLTDRHRSRLLLLITLAVTFVSLVALALALLAGGTPLTPVTASLPQVARFGVTGPESADRVWQSGAPAKRHRWSRLPAGATRLHLAIDTAATGPIQLLLPQNEDSRPRGYADASVRAADALGAGPGPALVG